MADIFSEETDAIFQELSFVTDFSIDKGSNKSKDETKEEMKGKDIHDIGEIEGQQIIDVSEHADSIDSEQIFCSIEKLVNPDLDTEQRLEYVEKIVKYLSLHGPEKEAFLSLSSTLSLLEKEDEETIDGILEELPVYILFCKTNHFHFNLVIRQHLVPYVMKQFSKNCLQVRKKAHSALCSMLENNLVDSSLLSEWICPFISQIVKTCIIPLEIRKEDLNVMIKISPLVGKDLTAKFFLEAFVSLCEDSNSTLRQICAYNLHYLIDVVGQELSESTLLLSFINLCNDEEWEIRKACAAVFVKTAKSFNRKIRREILTDIFMNLLSSSHIVREIAYQNLGDFISSFAYTRESSSCKTPSNAILKRDQEQFNHLLNWKINNNESKNIDISLEENINKNINLLHNVDFLKLDDGHSNINNLTYVCSPFSNSCEISQTTNSQHRMNKIETNLTNSGQKVYDENEIIQSNSKIMEDESSVLNKLCDIRESLPALRKSFAAELSYLLSNNENMYNDFSYWKIPIPEIESDGFEVPSITKESMCGKNSKYERKLQIYQRSELEELSMRKVRCDLKKKQEKVSIQDIVPGELLKKYINCIMGYNENFQELCVQSFSSVVHTLGGQNWFMLRDAFLELAKSKFSIRKTIASSLHEFAAVLDEESVAKDLLPVFMMYIQLDANEVYFKVFEHLADFLKLGGKDARTAFSENLCRLPIMNVKSVNLWRHKLMLTEQLINVMQFYTLSEMQEYFLPFAVELLADKVSVVRQASVEMLAVIVKYLFGNKDTVIYVYQTLDLLLESYKKASKWMWRQLYVHVCEQLAIKESLTVDFYVNQIVPQLFSLIWDSVPNVRLSVARCISRSLIPLGYIPTVEKTHDQLMKQVLCSLHSDVEKDVRYFALQALNALPNIVIDSVAEGNNERNYKEEMKCISED